MFTFIHTTILSLLCIFELDLVYNIRYDTNKNRTAFQIVVGKSGYIIYIYYWAIESIILSLCPEEYDIDDVEKYDRELLIKIAKLHDEKMLKWLERLEHGEISSVVRRDLEVELTSSTNTATK